MRGEERRIKFPEKEDIITEKEDLQNILKSYRPVNQEEK
jgi:hypothetical protein